MLKVQLSLGCDLCKGELMGSMVCFDRPEMTAWNDVVSALAGEAEKQGWHVNKKHLCTPCVIDIDFGIVCILP